MGFALTALTTYTPPGRESVHALAERLGAPKSQAVFLEKILGIAQISLAEVGERLDGFLARVIDGLFQDFPEQRAVKPDLILYVHSTLAQVPADYDLLGNLQRRYDWVGIPTWGLSHLNCASITAAFQFLERLASNPVYRKILIVTGDLTQFLPEARYIPNSTAVGDSASAMIFEREKTGLRLLATSLLSDPHVSRTFYESEEELKSFGVVYQEKLHQACSQALEKAGVTWANLNLVLPHNVNLRTWKRFCHTYGIPEEKVIWENLTEMGHSYCNDGQVNLAHALQNQRLGRGDKVLWVSVGLGSFFGAAVYEY